MSNEQQQPVQQQPDKFQAAELKQQPEPQEPSTRQEQQQPYDDKKEAWKNWLCLPLTIPVMACSMCLLMCGLMCGMDYNSGEFDESSLKRRIERKMKFEKLRSKKKAANG